jgi:hypothetical protein
MRTVLFNLALVIGGLGHVAAALVASVGCLGVGIYFIVTGAALFAGLWAVFGVLVSLLAASLVRFPFFFVGWILAALAGCSEEYLANMRALNERWEG